MKFALVDGARREPLPSLSGQCPACGAVVVAKCGEVRVWHWSHKGRLSCDSWWEKETRWHRAWKSLFPVEWQEVPMRAESGELHIADVRTPGGLALEFQHSPIPSAERLARETFYGKLMWIVDGTRLKRDAPRVDDGLSGWRRSPEGEISLLAFPEEVFPRTWISCDAPVLFDFDGLTRRTDNLDELQLLPPSVVRDEAWWDLRRVYVPPDPLLCLLPKRFRGNAVYFTVARETLPRIANGEFKFLDWQDAHRQLEARYPAKPRPLPNQRFTNQRNWPRR